VVDPKNAIGVYTKKEKDKKLTLKYRKRVEKKLNVVEV